MQIAIIGAGGVGSAAARFLAQEGHQVLLLEQFTLDHDRGSSFGESRIIRRTYPDRLYTQLMDAAYPLWEELQNDAQEELFVRTGGIYFGRAGHPIVSAVEDALQSIGTAYEKLSAAACNSRFPGFRLLPGEEAVYQADSGFLRASACVRANVRLARHFGAELRESVQVRAISRQGAGWLVEMNNESIAVERVLVTAGAWTGSLLAPLQLPLQPTRQQYGYLRIAAHAEFFQPDRFPVWIDAGNNGRSSFYGFPADGHIDGVKFAWNDRDDPVDPDDVNCNVDNDYTEALQRYAAVRMPDLSSDVVYAKTCLYTDTPDRDFVIDAVPDKPGVFMISACSGHGFKFTVLMGRIGADLVSGKTPPYDLSRFSLSRFPAQVPQSSGT